MTARYSVRVTKDALVFCAAHFITFNGNVCEKLHGHNYRVAAEADGPLDENQYVVDFIALRDSLLEITKKLDHHVLLPTRHAAIHVSVEGEEVAARFEKKRWIFPLEDCVLLPLVQTTAELLAKYIADELLAALAARGVATPEAVRIEVDECFGQVGRVEVRP